MDLKYVFLADAANVSVENKLNAVGIFESVGAVSFPVVHPSLTVVAVFRVRPVDVGRHREITIRLLTSDGIEMFRAQLVGEVSPAPLPDVTPLFHAIVTVPGLRFEDPGIYEFSVEIDDHPIGSATLSVIKVDHPASSTGLGPLPGS